jgi:diadenylate cyclase
MNDFWQQLMGSSQLAGNFNVWEAAKVAFQVLIIFYAVAWIWRRIRSTQAERLIKGVMILAMVWIACNVLGLTMITAILREMIPVLLIGVVIVFQPELRRVLGYLGRTGLRLDLSLSDTQNEMAKEVIEHIIRAATELSRNKTGALIVVEPPEGERDYISPGTTLNSEVSASLLLCIFNTTSPLHDGAVVIRQNKIVAAGVILPMTVSSTKLSYRYGTRHRAALGLSEKYDGLCIVVSEETGAISAANRGMLVRYHTAEELADALNYMYRRSETEPKTETQNPWQAFLQVFRSDKSKQASRQTDAAVVDYPRRRITDSPEEQGAEPNLEKAPEKDLSQEGQTETA